MLGIVNLVAPGHGIGREVTPVGQIEQKALHQKIRVGDKAMAEMGNDDWE